MTNRRLIQQQIDDYEKDYARVFGEYSDAIDAYNARIEQAKGGDHVAIQDGSGYLITDTVDGGELRASGGVTPGAEVTQLEDGRIGRGGTYTWVDAARDPITGQQTNAAGMQYIGGETYDVLRKPAEPDPVMPPRFTNKQLASYHNPQPTYADSAKADGRGIAEKYTGLDEWRSGITTDKGILQRVLQGAYK